MLSKKKFIKMLASYDNKELYWGNYSKWLRYKRGIVKHKVNYIIGLIALFLLLGCSAQNLQPTAPVYNVTINQTDNSQVVIGNNNKPKATPLTQTKAIADIKPEVKADGEMTTKNGMWIVWLVIIFGAILLGIYLYKKTNLFSWIKN